MVRGRTSIRCENLRTQHEKGLALGATIAHQFQRLASKLEWHISDSLNGYMVAQRRSNAMTYDEIAEWCTSRFDLPVMNSIQMTISDPAMRRNFRQ